MFQCALQLPYKIHIKVLIYKYYNQDYFKIINNRQYILFG